jgi:hypothetical protein
MNIQAKHVYFIWYIQRDKNKRIKFGRRGFQGNNSLKLVWETLLNLLQMQTVVKGKKKIFFDYI